MKKLVPFLLMVVFFASGLLAQVQISTGYNYPTDDTLKRGLQSIRGVAYHANPFGTGKSAILATNYFLNGAVHLFVSSGNDQLELVWSSPVLTTGGGGSTPRYATFGDLDNDNLIEIIYQSNNNGVFIYEWDGVATGYNFGTTPSQTIGNPPILNLTGNSEYFEVLDIDGDNQKELLLTYNANSNATDIFYVISATGDWSTGNPGFSGFNLEKSWVRTDMAAWGLSAGSPYSMISAQLDGTGNKEFILHNWNFKNVVPVRATGTDTYAISDTTGGKGNYLLGGTVDDVALFAGTVTDIDGDGREEIYLPTYWGDVSHAGWVHMLHWSAGQSTSQIDSTNVTLLNSTSATSDADGMGAGTGDLDGDGKKEIYVSGVYPYNVAMLEFQGGDKKDPANWTAELIYAGEKDIYTSVIASDSAGVKDTVRNVSTAFASKIWANHTDYDKDGKQDIILPYQALNDSTRFISRVYNSSTSTWDTTSNVMQLNPKRWSLRVIESTTGTGIEAKEISIISPEDYVLEQNYPNPFNPSTSIRFNLPVDKNITLKIYDILGNEVASLLNDDFKKGAYEITWDGTNNSGAKVASGTYIAELRFGNFAKSIKMTLLK